MAFAPSPSILGYKRIPQSIKNVVLIVIAWQQHKHIQGQCFDDYCSNALNSCSSALCSILQGTVVPLMGKPNRVMKILIYS